MKKRIFRNALLLIFLCAGFSCTNLDVEVYDKTTKFWKNEKEIAAGVAPAYAGLRSIQDFTGPYSLNEMTSDEIIVPKRGGDWNDGNAWEELWKHQWTSNHGQIENSWKILFSGISSINKVLKSVSSLEPKPLNINAINAELITVRAYYYLVTMDLFGNVPISIDYDASTSCLSNKGQTRKNVFNFIESEVKKSLPDLSDEVSPLTYGRATKWFAHCILAKLYLNAEVYIGENRYQECINSCNTILESNKFKLEPDFFTNFKIQNEKSIENIFAIPYDKNGLNDFITWAIPALTLHYVSDKTFGLNWEWGFGGVNGLCSTAEYVNQFSDQDIRKKMFLTGQQYVNQIASPANMQYDFLGNPLNFDPVITSFTLEPAKIQTAGARCVKWEIDKTSLLMSNDFSVYRLADIILTKAESQLRLGNATGALETLNKPTSNGVTLRSRTGLGNFTMSEMNLDELLKERARELSWEGQRRTDLIRFGHYLDARIPEKNVSENFRTIFPIPRSVMNNNPCLVQNPGYN